MPKFRVWYFYHLYEGGVQHYGNTYPVCMEVESEDAEKAGIRVQEEMDVGWDINREEGGSPYIAFVQPVASSDPTLLGFEVYAHEVRKAATIRSRGCFIVTKILETTPPTIEASHRVSKLEEAYQKFEEWRESLGPGMRVELLTSDGKLIDLRRFPEDVLACSSAS